MRSNSSKPSSDAGLQIVGELIPMITLIENSERLQAQPGQWWQGVSDFPELQNGAPQGFNRLTGQGVDFNSSATIKSDTINKTQLEQSIYNIRSLMRALTAYDAIQNAILVKDGNAASASGIAITGIFCCSGQDYLINGQGCYTVEQLSKQGRLQEKDKGYISSHLAFLQKFVMRWIS
jgi:hypothetical protein